MGQTGLPARNPNDSKRAQFLKVVLRKPLLIFIVNFGITYVAITFIHLRSPVAHEIHSVPLKCGTRLVLMMFRSACTFYHAAWEDEKCD